MFYSLIGVRNHLGIVLLVFVYVERLARSPFGKALKAMRDCELAAQVFGRDIVKLRTQALVISSEFVALGGALYIFFVNGKQCRCCHRRFSLYNCKDINCNVRGSSESLCTF